MVQLLTPSKDIAAGWTIDLGRDPPRFGHMWRPLHQCFTKVTWAKSSLQHKQLHLVTLGWRSQEPRLSNAGRACHWFRRQLAHGVHPGSLGTTLSRGQNRSNTLCDNLDSLDPRPCRGTCGNRARGHALRTRHCELGLTRSAAGEDRRLLSHSSTSERGHQTRLPSAELSMPGPGEHDSACALPESQKKLHTASNASTDSRCVGSARSALQAPRPGVQ